MGLKRKNDEKHEILLYACNENQYNKAHEKVLCVKQIRKEQKQMRTETIRLYEGREDVTLTTYLLDDSPELLKGGARPAIVICPGGAYLNCSDREAEPVALRFAAMGYHAFVLRYSVYQEGCGGTPDWTKPIEPKLQCQYPKQMREMGMAMRLIKSKGYQAVRKHCPPSVAVVIHDRFCLEQWEDFMPAEEYPGVVIDTHMYLFMLEVKMPDKQLSAYEKMIQKGFEERLERAEKFHPVIVGEWCIANKSSGIKELPEKEKVEAYRRIGHWQLKAWEACSGWIFWSYKLHAAGKNDWDYQRAIESGWLENNLSWLYAGE